MGKSLAEEISDLTEEQQAEIFAHYTPDDYEKLKYDANFWLRPEQKVPDGPWFITALVAGRGFGKLIRLDTPVPTPTGWTTMGELKDGDSVIDENGNPCNVVEAHPIQYPKKAYRLTFSDGTSIDAGEEHQWVTWTHADRKSFGRSGNRMKNINDTSQGYPEDWVNWTRTTRWGHSTGVGPKIRTTQDIVDSFYQTTARGDLNHSIPLTRPLNLPEAVLPIDPYILGCWLGDGYSNTGAICGLPEDITCLEDYVKSTGGEVVSRRSSKGRELDVLTIKGLTTSLNKAGLLNNKHVPNEYLRSSVRQRMALLAGLLDTDGHIHKENGHIEFCNTNASIAYGALELFRSLGERPTISLKRLSEKSDRWKDAYRVTLRPKVNYFTLPRKSEGLRVLDSQGVRHYHRMITAFEEIPVQPMRCISVDSPNSMYLVGEGMIPTHNTLTASQWIRRKALENPGCRIAIAARTVADVRNTMILGESGVLAVHAPDERPEYKPSTTSLHWPNGSTALLLSSESPDGARGPQFHYAVGDEFAAWKTNVDSSGATLFSNLIAATRLGENPQMLLATTPKRTAAMKKIMTDAKDPEKRVVIVTGSTFDNRSLSKNYIDNLVGQYGNSDLAKQELDGMMLEDAEGLVFTQKMIDDATDNSGIIPKYPLRFVTVDPSVSENPNDECGIIVIGVTQENDLTKRTAHILEDYSLKASPDVWSKVVVQACKDWGTSNVVFEKNQGGNLISMAITAVDPTIKTFPVVATKGKQTRAEPVVVVMEQGRVKFNGVMAELFDQMVYFDPEMSRYSPDRYDAFNWAVIAAMISPPPGLRAGSYQATSAAHRRLPTGIGSGRTRATGSVRRR